MFTQICTFFSTLKGCRVMCIYLNTIKQFASIKSSLLLKIQMQNTQTFQLFTKIIKTESIYKSCSNVKLKAWDQRPSGLIQMAEEAWAKCLIWVESALKLISYIDLPYFIEYNAHTSIVHNFTMIFAKNNIFIFQE